MYSAHVTNWGLVRDTQTFGVLWVSLKLRSRRILSTKVLNLEIYFIIVHTSQYMVFNLEKFLKAPDARVFETLKKDELFEFVIKFHLNIKRSARKVYT